MPQTIRAAVLHQAPGELAIEAVTIDDPGPDEVLIDVAFAGLCHSDLHEIDATFPTVFPIVLGHEASGTVEAIGAGVLDIRPGDTVVTCLSASCGSCEYCLQGRQTLCLHRNALTQSRPRPRLVSADGTSIRGSAGVGAFADKVVVHRSMVAALPQPIPLDVASILGCAVTTGMGAVLHSAEVVAGESVAVIGLGGVGMSAIQAATLAGASPVIGIDVVERKLADAKRFGATHVVNAAECDSVAAVRELTGGGVHHAFEAVGSGRTAGDAFAMLRPGGAATVVGMIPESHSIPINGADLFVLEKQLRGSFMGSNHFKTDSPRYVRLHAEGRLHLDALVTHHVPFTDINKGFARLAAGNDIRVVTRIGNS